MKFLIDWYWSIWRFFANLPYNFRQLKFRIKLGFWPVEVWNFDRYLTSFILPRLKYLRQNHCGYPFGITNEQWEQELDFMINAFELHEKLCNGDITLSPGEVDNIYQQISHGLMMFAKRYNDLWD